MGKKINMLASFIQGVLGRTSGTGRPGSSPPLGKCFMDEEGFSISMDSRLPAMAERIAGWFAIPRHTRGMRPVPPCPIRRALLGTALGDIAGSIYEGWGLPDGKDPDAVPLIAERCSFTDDTVMAVAVAEAGIAIRDGGITDPAECAGIYAGKMREYARKYPDAGYGGHFYDWAVKGIDDQRYRSYGNGAAMRSGPLGAVFNDPGEAVRQALFSALPTHSHPEGIRGAIVAAACTWLALRGMREAVLEYACRHYADSFREPLGRFSHAYISPAASISELKAIAPYTCSPSCQYSVPEAAANFANSDSLEGCVRNSFRYWCDTDTVGAISGSIAGAFYGTDGWESAVLEKCGPLPGLARILEDEAARPLG